MKPRSITWVVLLVHVAEAVRTLCGAPYQRFNDSQVDELRKENLRGVLQKSSKRQTPIDPRDDLSKFAKRQTQALPQALELTVPPHQRWNWGDYIWRMCLFLQI